MKLPKPTKEQAEILQDQAQCKIVIAVPGSGKTTLLFQAIKRAIENENCNSLLISFTKRATKENLLKVSNLFPLHKNKITVKTFDAFCHGVIVENWKAIGYSKPPKFDSGFNSDLLDSVYKNVIKKHSFESLDKTRAKEVIEKAIRFQTTIKRIIKRKKYDDLSTYYDVLNKIRNLYLNKRLDEGVFHYSEQVIQTYKLLSNSESFLEKIVKKYPIILVDEVQDLSPKQLQIASLLASKAQQIYFVGDDAQSIYRFRGVEANNFDKLQPKLPHSKCFTLSQSFRCSIPVVNFASQIRDNIDDVTQIEITSNKKGPKPSLLVFKNENAQYKYIASRIKELNDDCVPYSDIAIISRLHKNLTHLQRQLETQNISVKSKYTEDENQTDIEVIFLILIKILKLINEGYNEDYVASIFNYLGIEDTQVHYDYISAEISSKNKAARKHENVILKSFSACLIKSIKAKSLESKTEVVIRFLIKHYQKYNKHYIKAHLSQALVLSKNTKDLSSLIKTLEQKKFEREDCVSLLTVHASKGLEFDYVFFVDCDTFNFPYKHSILHHDNANDELKLFYVAITRAKKSLCITLVVDDSLQITSFITDVDDWKRYIKYY